jgi:hypothetical protein
MPQSCWAAGKRRRAGPTGERGSGIDGSRRPAWSTAGCGAGGGAAGRRSTHGEEMQEAKAVTAELRPAEAAPVRATVMVLRPGRAHSLGLSLSAEADEQDIASLAVVRPVELDRPECGAPAVTAPAPSAAFAPRDQAVPLTAELNRLHVTVSKEFLRKLDAARSALSHSRRRPHGPVQPMRRSRRRRGRRPGRSSVRRPTGATTGSSSWHRARAAAVPRASSAPHFDSRSPGALACAHSSLDAPTTLARSRRPSQSQPADQGCAASASKL